MYNSYEEYMQSVLGYNMPNTYRESENYYMPQMSSNMQEVNRLYPEIYSIVYPMVQKVCSKKRTMRNNRRRSFCYGRRNI